MHFWYLLNPLHSREQIELPILLGFLKVVFDPYFDGSDSQFQQLVADAGRVVDDIKRLEMELDADMDFDTLEEQQRNEGIWLVTELLSELLLLSDNFLQYKRGFVAVPSMKFREVMLSQLAECTFHPKVALQSTLMDQHLNKKVAGKIFKRRPDRVALLYEKENERRDKLSNEREKLAGKELEGCTFKPKLVAKQALTGDSFTKDPALSRLTSAYKNVQNSRPLKKTSA